MKNLLLPILILLFYFNSNAQKENFCSQAKISSNLLKRTTSPASAALMNNYDVKFYHLTLDVTKDTNFIVGNVRTIARVLSSSLDTFVFELQSTMRIDSIKIGAATLPYIRRTNDVYAVLPLTYNLGDDIDIVIYYNGYTSGAGSSAIGDGYSNGRSTRWGNKVAWSLSQPFSAAEWFPCKQDLTDKIDSSFVYATCDTPSMCGSNGLLKNIVILPSGKRQFQWENIHPIDYYLISVATANYIDYSTYVHPLGSDSVLFQNYVYNNPLTLPTFKGLIDTTGYTLEFFSTIFGPYPFAQQKYGHCLAPFSGGMEHQTMTSQGFFDFEIDAHELGHQWFGDNVTCQTWKDIWVNEGFASYCEYLADEHYFPGTKAAKMLNVHNSVMSQPGGSVWFTDSTNVNRIFSSRLTYDKGSAIIHTLRFLVNNDSLFFLGLRTYQNTYKNSTATAIDFKNTMESVTGVILNDWMNQWFYGEGYPTYDVNWNQVGNQLYLKVAHTTSTTITTLFKTPLELKLIGASSDTTIKININTNSDDFIMTIPSNLTMTDITVDPNNWILNKVGNITKDLSLNVAAIENTKLLSIYPTNTTGIVNIESSSPIQMNLKVYNTNAALVYATSLNNSSSIDLSHLTSGNYTIQIENEFGKAIQTQKINKQ